MTHMLPPSSYFQSFDIATTFSLCDLPSSMHEIIKVASSSKLLSTSLEASTLVITATAFVVIDYINHQPASPLYTLHLNYSFTHMLLVPFSFSQGYHLPCLQLEDCFCHLLSPERLYCNFHFLALVTPYQSTQGDENNDCLRCQSTTSFPSL